MDNPENKKLKTNWKYLLIVIILGFIVGGGILCYQYWWLPQKGIELPEVKKEVKPPLKEEFIEVPIEELKEGENKIGDNIIRKITSQLLCNLENIRLDTKFKQFMEGLEIKIGALELKNLDLRRESGRCEANCYINNRAKVKLIGWSQGYYEGGFSININKFLVTDKDNNVVDEHGDGEERIEFYNREAKIKSLNYNKKIYFLVSGGVYGATGGGTTEYFLYAINENDEIRLISHWTCDEYSDKVCIPEYGLEYKNNLYLKIGNEIWDIGEDEVLRDKFPANKIIIKDSEISFK